MFILDEEDSEGRVVKGFPITINTIRDSGAVTKSPMTIDYKILPTDRSDSIITAAQDGDDSDLLKEVIVGWGLVKNKAGEVVDFSQDALDAACKKANFRAAALKGYFKAASGEKPRRGN